MEVGRKKRKEGRKRNIMKLRGRKRRKRTMATERRRGRRR